MLLAEVKKLKVAELRAMLTERGLDPKGLKAELAVRLISAIEAGVEPIKSGNEGETTRETTDKSSETHADELPKPSLEYERCAREQTPVCTNISNMRIRTCIDKSTQTDPNQLCSCAATRTIAQQLTSATSEVIITHLNHPGEEVQQEKPPQSPAHPVAVATAASVKMNVVSGCSSPVSEIPVSDGANEQDHLLNRQSDSPETVDTTLEEITGMKRPCDERGRDYYEFKEDIHYIRAKAPDPLPDTGDEDEIDFEDVRLDLYNCDLHFEVTSDGSGGQPLFWEKFPLLWSGCRMTHGFCQGKIGFEVKFVKCLCSPALDTSYDSDLHMLRVGWSVDNSSLQLGEGELSYGFDGQGKIVTSGKEEEFGEPFSEGDIIGCFAAINERGKATLSFHKNGRSLGVAFQLTASALGGQALYPHILCKNCSVCVNIDPDTRWHSFPADFCTLTSLPPGQRIRALLPAATRRDCEVLMMVGLPGSGKTHWAQSHMKRNPKKRYHLISTNSVLDCMRVPPGGNHRDLMLQQATQCVSQLIRIAANKRRNYIVDQANIYPSAQLHKMMCFHGYQRKAMVVFPADEVWKRRLVQHIEVEGTAIPEMSLLKAKASFTLPEQGEHLDEVMFVELCFDEALKLLKQYKEEARSLLPTPTKRKKHRHGNHKQFIHHCGRRGSPYSCQSHNQCSLKKKHGWPPSGQSYGCGSDPQRYRKYYRPYTGQWNWCDQSQNYYGCST
ncbi:heterogeneous nuclear ribonucleoprotein U-like protein 2 [Triplophysa dalaica]|uniref:heterogeneous nuclear ribonucleoprotein U-like protein 2 n=1 Tax=Triplophysa dalaica TaxID=1582913 RepID=UPI0024DFD774|nr:heterogeneous nuclear ribonucleoprotein U-like protein 2 [Triplophysa dalaica]